MKWAAFDEDAAVFKINLKMAYNKKSLENLLHWDKKKITTVQEFHKRAVEYFMMCLKDEVCPDMAGLVFHLGFNSRQSLLNYEGYKDEKELSYLDTIRASRNFIYKCKKEWLISGKGSAQGLKFDLINNYDYKDKSEVSNDHTTQGEKISIQPIQWIDGSSKT